MGLKRCVGVGDGQKFSRGLLCPGWTSLSEGPVTRQVCFITKRVLQEGE